jgi:hypothetical protein
MCRDKQSANKLFLASICLSLFKRRRCNGLVTRLLQCYNKESDYARLLFQQHRLFKFLKFQFQ